ncbi:transmembrane amino acid transporter protein-domain-containing protein [Vararia minispora EC-137]|uniref:Transmembrane amino acid transporter protein-domain-containing protein n=1 Tax=Vararia minispora EC-137 TaxID=1314806 RepID=A0ACB8QI01_9AGAM|nr:transmembrane amino acid transporter protein-domain-containing protein [Vararia minispora EC-137]
MISSAEGLIASSYLIIVKSLAPSVVASLYQSLAPGRPPPEWTANGRVWLILALLILVPFSFMRHLHSLRHMSYVALFSVVVVCYFEPLEDMPPRGEVHLVNFTPSFISTFPIQVFAFSCSMNIFPIYNEVKVNSQARMNTIIGLAVGGTMLVYEAIAVFGYLTFGSNVGANIIAMYPSTSLLVAVGQLAIAILVLFSYPLQLHPTRNCLDKVIHSGFTTVATKLSSEDDVMDYNDEDYHAADEMSPFKFFMLTTAILVTGFTVAYFVDDLQMGGTTMSFILPGLFYWKMFRNESGTSKGVMRAALALVTYGTCVLIIW